MPSSPLAWPPRDGGIDMPLCWLVASCCCKSGTDDKLRARCRSDVADAFVVVMCMPGMARNKLKPAILAELVTTSAELLLVENVRGRGLCGFPGPLPFAVLAFAPIPLSGRYTMVRLVCNIFVYIVYIYIYILVSKCVRLSVRHWPGCLTDWLTAACLQVRTRFGSFYYASNMFTRTHTCTKLSKRTQI